MLRWGVERLLRLRRLVGQVKIHFFVASPATESPETCFSFRELTANDIQSAALFSAPGRRQAFAQRLTEGHRCFGFCDAEKAVAYFWLSEPGATAPPLGAGAQLLIPNGMSYIWDCRTDEAYQGQGLYRQGLLMLRQRVSGDVMIAADPVNRASLAGIRAAGFVSLGPVEFRRLVVCFVLKSTTGISLHIRRQLPVYDLLVRAAVEGQGSP